MNAKLIGGLMENSSSNNNELLSLCDVRALHFWNQLHQDLWKSNIHLFLVLCCYAIRIITVNWIDWWVVTGAVHIHSFFLLTHARRSNPLSLIKTDFVRSFVCLFVRLFSTFVWLGPHMQFCAFNVHIDLYGNIYGHLCWHCQLFAFVLQQF